MQDLHLRRPRHQVPGLADTQAQVDFAEGLGEIAFVQATERIEECPAHHQAHRRDSRVVLLDRQTLHIALGILLLTHERRIDTFVQTENQTGLGDLAVAAVELGTDHADFRTPGIRR